MKRRPQTQSCPECGSAMVYERRDDLLKYKGHERTIKTLGFWCSNCGEGILTGKPLLASEKAFLTLKAEVDDLERQATQDQKKPVILAPKEVANVRKRLGLSRKEASDLLGEGPRAFAEYESGKIAVSIPLSNLLRLLDNDPRRLRELAGPTLVKAPGLPPPRRVVEVSRTAPLPAISRGMTSVTARARATPRRTGTTSSN